MQGVWGALWSVLGVASPIAGEDDPRDRFADARWYPLACRFADDWDMQSFDPRYDSQPLERFAPLVEKYQRTVGG